MSVTKLATRFGYLIKIWFASGRKREILSEFEPTYSSEGWVSVEEVGGTRRDINDAYVEEIKVEKFPIDEAAS